MTSTQVKSSTRCQAPSSPTLQQVTYLWEGSIARGSLNGKELGPTTLHPRGRVGYQTCPDRRLYPTYGWTSRLVAYVWRSVYLWACSVRQLT